MTHWRKRMIQAALVAAVAFASASPAATEGLACDFGQQVTCYNECFMNTHDCTQFGGIVLVGCSGGCFVSPEGEPVCDSGVVCYFEY